MAEFCFFQISVLTNFDFLYDDEAEDVSWGPEYEDRRLSYCSLDVGSLDRDMKSNLQILECLSGSEQDLTPHDSSDDEDEVLFNIGKGHFLFGRLSNRDGEDNGDDGEDKTHMRIRYHFIANLQITETRSILFLTKYDKNI